jgi:small basic protein
MAEGIKILAEAIAILAGSVVALTLVDTGKMWIAVGAIGALAVIIGALAAALNHFANGATVIQSLQLNSTLLSIAGSFLLLSIAAKILGTMDSDSVKTASIMLAEFTGVVTALVLLAKFAGGKNLNLASSFLTKVGACFILLGVAARLLGGMDATSMKSAGIMLAAFTGVVDACD